MAPRDRLTESPPPTERHNDVGSPSSTPIVLKSVKSFCRVNTPGDNEADIARDRHDLFNIVALVRRFAYVKSQDSIEFSIKTCLIDLNYPSDFPFSTSLSRFPPQMI